MKIAIIDDEPEILIILEKYIKRVMDVEVDTYMDTEGFIENVQNYEIVLLDIMMPKVDGMSLLKKIKEKSKNTKVIMMTANSTIDSIETSVKYGAEEYLSKPFISLIEVTNKIKEIM